MGYEQSTAVAVQIPYCVQRIVEMMYRIVIRVRLDCTCRGAGAVVGSNPRKRITKSAKWALRVILIGY